MAAIIGIVTGGVVAGPAQAACGDGGPGCFNQAEEEVFELIYRVRQSYGCRDGLRHDYALTRAARHHSRDMANSRFLSHEGSDHSRGEDRLSWVGYDPAYGWGENIAYGYDDSYTVVRAWMNSPSHRKNILTCQFRALGVGVTRAEDGTLYWTQEFGGR